VSQLPSPLCHNRGKLIKLTRSLISDPWWIFTTANLFYNIRFRYELRLIDIIRTSPRFGILLFCMILSVIFIIVDLLSVTPVIPIGVINPFWKFAFVFKCLTDTIILDDFKTALDKLSRHRMSQILPLDAVLRTESNDQHVRKKRDSWSQRSGVPSTEQVECFDEEEDERRMVRFPPKIWSDSPRKS
jgi:hypothetical protein